ncbi:MAG: replicative DNA helicase [Candidatus Kaiserbacteria bacterium]|nr:replicative DNA helicase [Candidatus Kaiserbacteria bacterium]
MDDYSAETYALAPPTAKVVPHDMIVEQSLLGALLWNADKFHDVAEVVESDAFYAPRNRHIFEAMATIASRGDAIDSVTVSTQLANAEKLEMIGGREYLGELVEQSPAAAHLESYAKIVQDKYTRRRLQTAGTAIAEISTEGEKDIEQVIDESERELFEITQTHTHARYKQVADAIPDLVQEIIKVSDNTDQHRGISTGYPKIDDALSGFHPADLIILAARPSVGKTSLALDIARRSASKQKTPVGIFSLEMSTSQLIERLLATESRLDAWRMRTGKIKSQQDFSALNEAADRLRTLPIFIDDRSGMSTLTIRSTARRMKREHDIKMLIVDYLQLITPHDGRGNDSMVQHITEVSRTLKQVARELSIPVLALSQLSRDVEKREGKPRLSDLRDSGSIEQDADVVMFLHRRTDQMYDGEDDAPIPIDLMIEKHRNGPTGKVALQFDRKHATFIEPANETYESQAPVPEAF